MNIRIQRLGEDYDAAFVELFVSDDGFAARQEFYAHDEQWLEFGAALQSFPRSVEHEVSFECGTPEGECGSYALLRAFVHDAVGHAALEVRLREQAPPPHCASAHFYILCEAATLNRLGRALELWSRSRGAEFVFPCDAA